MQPVFVPASATPAVLDYDDVHPDLVANHVGTMIFTAEGVLAALVYPGEGYVLGDGEWAEHDREVTV